MAQNTSHAVMAQKYDRKDFKEDYPTQPWATRALCKHVLSARSPSPINECVVWEPACNRGHMAEPLKEYFGAVVATDIHDYGYAQHEKTVDFLFPGSEPSGDVDWIITNPPFRLAEQFIVRALGIAVEGVAMIVRTSFLESVGRYANLFTPFPPSIIAQFTERVPMVKGRLTEKGSTATAYCWIVWTPNTQKTEFMWIPPSRKQLERKEDYASN